jgi:uncharacterized membrane protein
MNASAISHVLRNDHSKDLVRRRKVSLLSALGAIDFSVISLYQTGIIKHLPDIPSPLFDSDKVNGSKDAYRFGVPDGPIGVVTYGLIMALASAGGSEKTDRAPAFDAALGATVAGNALGAIFYLHNMIFKQKKICPYCVTGAAINIASAIIIAPTVLKSIKKIMGRK